MGRPHLRSLDPAVPEAWEGGGSQHARVWQPGSRRDPVSFLILQPRLLEGVSLTLKGLVLSCLPAACPWPSRFAELSTQQRLGRLSCCSWEQGAEKSSCPRWPRRVCKPGPPSPRAALQPCLLRGPSEPRRASRGPWRSALLRPYLLTSVHLADPFSFRLILHTPAQGSGRRLGQACGWQGTLLKPSNPLSRLAGDASSPPSKKEWLLGKQGTQFWNVRGQAGSEEPQLQQPAPRPRSVPVSRAVLATFSILQGARGASQRRRLQRRCS